MDKDDTLDLASQLQSAFDGSDQDIAMSAIFLGNSVGFPLRIADPEKENYEEEPGGFDEAYDFATEVLDTDNPEVSTDGGYVWLEDTTSK